VNNDTDFIANLFYHPTENGGRKTPAKTGYRPQIKFDFTENSSSGIQKFIGKEFVLPGEEVCAEITILSPSFFENKLEVGMQFIFSEGKVIIGTGKIIEITNQTLKRASL